MRNAQAFSIVELIVVVIVLGVLAAMAIPSYIKGIDRTYARDAVNVLQSIQSAQLIYVQTNNGTYYASSNPPSDDTAGINTALNLNVTPSGGTTFYCDSTPACYADRQEGAGAFKIVLYLKLPMVSLGKTLVYCNQDDKGNKIPDNAYNPCCTKIEGAAGAVCP